MATNVCGVDYDLETCERLLTPAAAHSFRQFLRESVPDRVVPQVAEALARMRLLSQPDDAIFLNHVRGTIAECIDVALNNLPAQLLIQDLTSPSPLPGLQPEQEPEPVAEHRQQRPSMTDAPTAHNTAQIGAQFPAHMPDHRPGRASPTGRPVVDNALETPAQTWTPTATAHESLIDPVVNQATTQEVGRMPLDFDFNHQPPMTLSPMPNWGHGNNNSPPNALRNDLQGATFPYPLAGAFLHDAADSGDQPAPMIPARFAATNGWQQPYAVAPGHPYPNLGATQMGNDGGHYGNFEAFDLNSQGGTAPYSMPNAQFLFREGNAPYFGGDNNGQWDVENWYDANEQQQQ